MGWKSRNSWPAPRFFFAKNQILCPICASICVKSARNKTHLKSTFAIFGYKIDPGEKALLYFHHLPCPVWNCQCLFHHAHAGQSAYGQHRFGLFFILLALGVSNSFDLTCCFQFLAGQIYPTLVALDCRVDLGFRYLPIQFWDDCRAHVYTAKIEHANDWKK